MRPIQPGRLTLLAILLVLFILASTVKRWGRLFFPFPYRETVARQAVARDLDPLLIGAVIREESAFDPRAVSSRGAMGLMQIMPETGSWIGEQLGEEVPPRRLFVPEDNIRYGAYYLSFLYQRYRGDRIKALAAYNAGHNRVEEWLAAGAWDGTLADLERLPYAETKRYVLKILRSYRVYRYLYG